MTHGHELRGAECRRVGIMGGRVFRNNYEGHIDKTKGEGGSRRGRWVWLE